MLHHLLLLSSALGAAGPLAPEFGSVWSQATRLSSLGRHGAADTLARSQSWSRTPEGLVLRATIALGEYADIHEPERLARAQVLLSQADRALESDISPKGRWLAMLALSQESFLLSMKGSELQATLKGRKAAGVARALHQGGSTDPEVLGVLGSYLFWKAQVLGPLRTAFGGDTRSMGLSLTERAVAANSPLREVWRTSLLWIRFERKEYPLALKVAQDALAACPGNRLYRQAEGDILFRLGRLDDALERYRVSWHEYAGIETIPVNRQSAAGNLARIHFAAGRNDSARSWLDTLDAPRYAQARGLLPSSLVRELKPVRAALGR